MEIEGGRRVYGDRKRLESWQRWHGGVREFSRKVRLPGKGNSNFHGARPVDLIITMIKWIRGRLSIKNSLSCGKLQRWKGAAAAGQEGTHSCFPSLSSSKCPNTKSSPQPNKLLECKETCVASWLDSGWGKQKCFTAMCSGSEEGRLIDFCITQLWA